VLLFHGTGGPRETIDSIITGGLVPHGGRAWASALTGVDAHVFACTTPIGTRDGDPIRFARAGAWKRRRAWMVVIDLPEAVIPELLVGAVRNEDLTRYWAMQSFAANAIASRFDAARAVIDRARADGCAARDLLRPVVTSVLPDLVAGTPDPHTLLQFEAAYYRARSSQKARVAASYGLRVPAWFADDPHYPWCEGCSGQLYTVELEATFAGRDGRPVRFSRGGWKRPSLETFAAHLDALGRWLAACDPDAFARFVGHRDGVPLVELQRAFPPPPDAVPATFRPDLITGDAVARAREPDVQVLLARVPPQLVVGAFDLGDARRLSPLVRPAKGQTLLDNLRHLAGELVEERARTGRTVIRT
jgi:hypothetical protein